MCSRKHRLLALGFSIFLAGFTALVGTEQAPAQPKPDGLVRTELSLGGRTATLSYAPDLKSTDAAHRPLLSPGGGAVGARVRVGQLETTGALRIGTLDLAGPAAPPRPGAAEGVPQDPASTPPQGPPVVRYDLWLEGAASGWQIRVENADKTAVGQLLLARQTVSSSSQNLVAALIPEDSAAGRLVVMWGGYRTTADVQFLNPQRRRTDENRAANVTTNRRHDEDTSVLSRARLLAQRNETAFVPPKGQRVSVSFQRTFARGERPEGGRTNRGLGVDGPDFARLMTTADGAIVMLTESPVPRLRTEASLRFGNVTLATGNQVVGGPGSYGLWLKKAGTGWRLVFNNEPDVWGSQHDPKSDASEIPLTHSEGHAAARPFAVGIMPTAADGGRLMIIWGPHEWTSDFVVAR